MGIHSEKPVTIFLPRPEKGVCFEREELARVLNVSVTQLYTWCRDEGLPRAKRPKGGFPAEGVRQWMEKKNDCRVEFVTPTSLPEMVSEMLGRFPAADVLAAICYALSVRGMEA